MKKIVYKPKPTEKHHDDLKKSDKIVYKSQTNKIHQEQLKKNPYLIFYDKPIPVTLPWYLKYFFLLIWAFIATVLFMMLNAYIQFSAQRKWWNKNGGKKYNKVFSINLLGQYVSFSLGYYIMSLFYSNDAKINTSGEKQFLIQMIARFGRLEPTDPDTYFMYPVHICESIVVGELTDHYDISDGQWDENGWPNNESTWIKLLNKWGVPTEHDSSKIDNNKWTTDPNNFLWQKYNLPLQTSFILSFMWGTAVSESKLPFYSQAFRSAVGLNKITYQNIDYSGGWWGFLKYGFGTEKDLSYGEIIRCLYEQEYVPAPPTDCDKGSIWGTSIAGGVSAGIPLAAFLYASNPFLAFGSALVVAAISIGTSVANGYQKCPK
jgi:hypothetical protein